ncbi:hypothetical protein ACOMHN_060552 [Nucella lapillus]
MSTGQQQKDSTPTTPPTQSKQQPTQQPTPEAMETSSAEASSAATTTATTTTTTVKPRGAELAKILKVGDRVQWNYSKKIAPAHQGKRGRVISIPSDFMMKQGGDYEQYVDVEWDDLSQYCCLMGYRGEYQLDLE